MRNVTKKMVVETAGVFFKANVFYPTTSDGFTSDIPLVRCTTRSPKYTMTINVPIDYFKSFADKLSSTYSDWGHHVTCTDLVVRVKENNIHHKLSSGDILIENKTYKIKADVVMTPGDVSFLQVVCNNKEDISKINRSTLNVSSLQLTSFAIDANASCKIKRFAESL